MNTKQIDGDVSVGRNVTAGGDATVRGDMNVGHNLKVDGWLEARNVKGPGKGLFADETALKEAYPHPQRGWYALVGDSLPADVWRVDTKGRWTPTGEKGGQPSLQLAGLEQDYKTLSASVQAQMSESGHLLGDGEAEPYGNVVVLRFTKRNNNGSDSNFRITIPAATALKAGVMQPAQLDALKNHGDSIATLEVNLDELEKIVNRQGLNIQTYEGARPVTDIYFERAQDVFRSLKLTRHQMSPGGEKSIESVYVPEASMESNGLLSRGGYADLAHSLKARPIAGIIDDMEGHVALESTSLKSTDAGCSIVYSSELGAFLLSAGRDSKPMKDVMTDFDSSLKEQAAAVSADGAEAVSPPQLMPVPEGVTFYKSWDSSNNCAETMRYGNIINGLCKPALNAFYLNMENWVIYRGDYNKEWVRDILPAFNYNDGVTPNDWTGREQMRIPTPRMATLNIIAPQMPTAKSGMGTPGVNCDIPCRWELSDNAGNYVTMYALMSAQGNSSLAYVKKNVSVDLFADQGRTRKMSLKIGDWVAQDSFHLKAYYTDTFRGVAVGAYKLYEEMMGTRGPNDDAPFKSMLAVDSTASDVSTGKTEDNFDTGARCFPDGFPVAVYLNGEFYGVYSWQLKKHRDNYHQKKSTAAHIHLDGSIKADTLWGGKVDWSAFEVRNPKGLVCSDGSPYDGDNPGELMGEESAAFDAQNKSHSLTAAVRGSVLALSGRVAQLRALESETGDGAERIRRLREAIGRYFNVSFIIDYILHAQVTGNGDGFAKNWQWTTWDGERWTVNPYDLDMSFGGHWQGDHVDAPPTGWIGHSMDTPIGWVITYFMDEIKARYRSLRMSGLLTSGHIASLVFEWVKRVGSDMLEREFERWPESPCYHGATSTGAAHYDSIYRVERWVAERIAAVDKLLGYEALEVTERVEAVEAALALFNNGAGVLMWIKEATEDSPTGVRVDRYENVIQLRFPTQRADGQGSHVYMTIPQATTGSAGLMSADDKYYLDELRRRAGLEDRVKSEHIGGTAPVEGVDIPATGENVV